jgi:hypothetical protein
MSTSAPEPGLDAEDHAGEEAGPKLGISLSGGGIRSATFSLGVCQRLIEAGILQRASYLSAVSGGSYLAAGLVIAHAECPPALREAEPPPWGRRSPEESELRRNLSYLAPGSIGRLWLFANLLYGLVLNLIPLVLGAYLCGRVAGLVLQAVYPGLAVSEHVDVSALPWVLLLAVLLVLSSIGVVGRRRFLDKDEHREQLTEDRSERTVMALLGLVGLVLVFAVALPGMMALLVDVSGGRATEFVLAGATFSIDRLLIGLTVIMISVGMGGAAVWMLRRRRFPFLRGTFAYLSGAGILFAPFLLAAETAAVRGFSIATDVPFFLGSAAVIVFFAILVHNRRYSMHLFYRERLQDAFAFRRVAREDGDYRVEKIPYDETIQLSKIAEENAKPEGSDGHSTFPELVICAAVAARGAEVPNKAWAASFTFEGQYSGNEALNLKAPTELFELGDWIGGGNVTLPAMMAISGAAVSPLMGRFTLPGFRFLMAMLNIRLGVWLRNPNFPREKSNPEASWLRGKWEYVVRGWREPGALYVLKEGLGLADTKGRYIYVSDGGHWENLGLTELLRRQCTEIVVVDASGDPGLGDIGRAMAVDRAELGIEFELEPLETLAGEDGLAETPVTKGSFEYPDGREGTIFYARSVLWPEAPSDLRLYADREQRFPNHPTSNQFLSGELFDAYRALGGAVGDCLSAQLDLLPPESWDTADLDGGHRAPAGA